MHKISKIFAIKFLKLVLSIEIFLMNSTGMNKTNIAENITMKNQNSVSPDQVVKEQFDSNNVDSKYIENPPKRVPSVYKYILTRDFADLSEVNLKNTIDAKILDEKLSGLKWITPLYPSEPKKEITRLNKAINIIKNDPRNKTIITDYQFISVILSTYDNSPSQVWFINHILNEDKESKYFKIYKDFFINKLRENKVKIVYIVKPMWAGDKFIERGFDKDCLKKTKITEILDSYLLEQCIELNN